MIPSPSPPESSAVSEEPARPPKECSLPIVGIGASAGGVEAISRLLGAVPADSPIAFVVVMHLDPSHESSLPEILGEACEMPVHSVTDGLELEPAHVYVIPPNHSMVMRGRSLYITTFSPEYRPRNVIDRLLESLAEEHAQHAIGVILSGSGDDGTAGLLAIKEKGGFAFAQDRSAAQTSMPNSAVASGATDAVLPPEEIARELTRVLEHPLRPLPPGREESAEEEKPILTEIVSVLSRSSGIDFLRYKQSTIHRRIRRRVILLGREGLEDYAKHLVENPPEAEALTRELLIHVTSFFRDPSVFRMLEELVFPGLVNHRSHDDPIRIWVPGCSSGEEVYSLVICLKDFMAERSISIPLKVFGTDVSEEAIARARQGRYPERIAGDLTAAQLQRYFRREGSSYLVSQAVRDQCVFARQDATRDPPFSRLDLVSCRNVLIYLGPELQKRLGPIFHYALRDGGFLLLGTAESVGAYREYFSTVNEAASLYARKPVPRRLEMNLAGRSPCVAEAGPHGSVLRTSTPADAHREADRVVLARYAPAGVVVDEELQILQFRGDTSPFLTPAPGAPSNSVLRMARDGLLPDLRSILEDAKAGNEPLHRKGVRIRTGGHTLVTDLELTPIRIPGSSERCYVILFGSPADGEPRRAPATAPVAEPPSSLESERVEKLERELIATRDYLRSNVERLEIANEELRSANEEILSSNEELATTNEELQTAKEELQASNEELLTTNEELQLRNQEVMRLGDDLTNLITSVQIPIVILGRDLAIRRFTPSAASLLGIAPSDLGRSLIDLKPPVPVTDLSRMVVEVLESLVVVEREVRDEEGHWFSLCVRPYRTTEQKVDGVVVSLTDIDALKRLADRFEESSALLESIVLSVRDPLLVLDSELKVRVSNKAFHVVFPHEPKSVCDLRLGTDVLVDAIPEEVRAKLGEVFRDGIPFERFDVCGTIVGRGERHLRLSAHSTPGEKAAERLVLLSLEDITDQERDLAEKERLSRKVQETQRLESLGLLAGGIAHDFNNILTSVLGFADLIRTELPPDSPFLAHTDRIMEGARRATELCNEMLAYSGRGRFQLKYVHLGRIVRSAAPLLRAMVSKRSELLFDLADSTPSVEVDLAQIRQVLANLVINASEALGESGGTITVSTGQMLLDEAYLRDRCICPTPPGQYVYLDVVDDGPGMSPETQARIFDPFFTTKFTGRGLGLAAVLGIVRGHGGTLKVQSAPGTGSRFRLLLPARAGVAPSEDAPVPYAETPWKGEGTILVVDDEQSVRLLLRSMLRSIGFRIVDAEHGAEGIEVLRTHADTVDLVLLDLTMPGLSGARVFEQMRKVHPDVPIVLMSGFDEEESMNAFPPDALAGFLRKPFEKRELAAELWKSLQAGDEFLPLIQKHTDDSAPGIYPMEKASRGRMVAGFGNVGWRLEVGEYGVAPFDPAASPYGWHIIKRLK